MGCKVYESRERETGEFFNGIGNRNTGTSWVDRNRNVNRNLSLRFETVVEEMT